MITEDYCSYEIAKLLKEKGFDEPTIGTYKKDETFEYLSLNRWNSKFITPISAPTLQMAMAWLREVYNLFIEPTVGETNGKTWYDFDIIPINGRKIAWNHYNNLPFVECNSNEEAIETALKYCLENLI